MRSMAVSACLAFVWVTPAPALDIGRMYVRVTWVDAYDSVTYGARQTPGMAVIAAPKTVMTWGFEIEGGAKLTEMQIVGLNQTAVFAQNGGRATVRAAQGQILVNLPDTGGAYPLTLMYRYPPSNASIDTAVLTVLIPASARIVRGRINGYVMGSYPQRADDRHAPDRFVEITPDLMDLHLSRNFRIRDFVSNSRTEDQQRFFPKYAVIRYSLILKVEKLVTLIDQSPKFQCKGIRVLSGFRTPDYNLALPEAAHHSYHQYGLAADIIVDSAPADGTFDDVNQDKKINLYDAAALAGICDHLEKMGALPIGGIGLYEHQTPAGKKKWASTYHVHIDVRETKKTRWGYVFRNGRKYQRLIWR